MNLPKTRAPGSLAAALYTMKTITPAHSWKFFRTGGLDQVELRNAADLLALRHLDQKLWVALACPVKGLELDEKTLALIDTDSDGRIRVPELIAAVEWAAARLQDPGDLLLGRVQLPLAAIADTPEGQALVASARRVLKQVGRPDADAISVEEAADTARIFSSSALHGDGIITPGASDDAAVQALINDIIKTHGGTTSRTGIVGVTPAMIDAFFADVTAYLGWVDVSATKQNAVLGDATPAAVSALVAVRTKIDDYFVRCALASVDPRAADTLNRSQADYAALAPLDLSAAGADVSTFPLARIEPRRPLPLLDDVNPAWAAALRTLHAAAVVPVFGADKTTLTREEWETLKGKLSGYEAWLASKPGALVEQLGLPRLRELAAGSARAAIAELVEKDKALAPEFQAIADVERLARYHRDLRTLLHNFVNFTDFYSPERTAVFQAGTLYFDSRAIDLCVKVDGPTPLSAKSQVCLAYCTCTRKDLPPITIAACITQGDSDYVFVGRHGLFYDRLGRDWDAVVTAVVENPISVRQAFFAPYLKFVRFIEEQVAKRAAAADEASTTKLAGAAEGAANADKVKPAPKKLDIGTVAAIGVAVGGITAAFGTIVGAFFGLGLWMPVGLIGILLAISGPSMLLAWLKLRRRTLGPILDSSGWAINGRVKINLPLGRKLTSVAHLPPGSRRSLEDPYEDKAAKRRKRLFWFTFVLIVLAVTAIWIRANRLKHGHYFWQPAPVEVAEPTPPPAAPADAS